MSINRSSYDRLNWIDALKVRKNPRDYEKRYASTSEADAVDRALEETVEAVFDVPTGEESTSDAIARTSIAAADQALAEANAAAVREIKAKLSDRDEPIDPVSLGVMVKRFAADNKVEISQVTQDEWDNATDPTWVEHVAKLAVVAFKGRRDSSWEQAGMRSGAQVAMSTPPEAARDGRLMPSYASNDDSAPRFGKVPMGTNSIADPGRLDRLAEEAKKERAKIDARRSGKLEAQKARRGEELESLKGVISQSDGSKILRSGGKDSEVFMQRVPSNQVSMTDDLSKGLEELFLQKLEDNKASTKKAAEERRKAIQGGKSQDEKKKEDRKSWEKVEKPASTASLQERLLRLWIPESDQK